MMKNDVAEILASIKPEHQRNIMDLVEAAGIDVKSWSLGANGGVVNNPRANPRYCYEWAFGGNGEPTVLCISHSALDIHENLIVYAANLRKFALDHNRLAIDRTKPNSLKSRARARENRARKFDSLLQHAYRKQEAIRAVLLWGEEGNAGQLGSETFKVKYRSLDSEKWYVQTYDDDTGSFQLVRGSHSDSSTTFAAPEVSPPLFADQFSIPDRPKFYEVVAHASSRSPAVRQTVLGRAQGICECCGEPGFVMESGAIYLETHHVFPLSEGGPDDIWNVVAVCPNDHRCAHFGHLKSEMRDQLVEKLLKYYPGATEAFQALREKQMAPKVLEL